MKKSLISILIFAALISCEKLGDLKYSESIPGGCFLDKVPSTNYNLNNVNQVTYKVVDGNLDIFLGFNATCCGEYSTNSEIKGDSILIKVTTTQIGACNCICYYTYDFKFIGSGDNFTYKVTVDDYLTFIRTITP
jgi:hypothetical protein